MDTDELHLNATFPLKASIWPGALLASIGHAIFVARAPFMTHEQSWDGLNYSVQDSEGSRGTISFDESKINFVAVFYLQTSRRNPLNRDVTNANDSTVYVRDVPDQLKKLTHEALQYVIPDVAGEAQPVITAAFWSDPSGSQVTASEPWRDVVEHGAVLVENQVLPANIGFERWVTDFEFNPVEAALVETLFKRRLAAANEAVRLTPAESQEIRRIANSEANLHACRESLEEIGIM